MKPPIIYNRLEDTNLKSVIGVDGVNTNATFEAGKFGNCARVDANNENMKFNNFSIDMNEFIISFWINTDYNIVNGVPSDSALHLPIQLLRASTTTIELQFLFHSNAAYGLSLWRDVSWQLQDITTDWSSGTWVHNMIVVSRSANFDGSKTSALYIDGTQTKSNTTALSDLGVLSMDMIVGNNVDANQPIDGLIDNIYVHSGVSERDVEIIKNRMSNERGCLNDQAIIL